MYNISGNPYNIELNHVLKGKCTHGNFVAYYYKQYAKDALLFLLSEKINDRF